MAEVHDHKFTNRYFVNANNEMYTFDSGMSDEDIQNMYPGLRELNQEEYKRYIATDASRAPMLYNELLDKIVAKYQEASNTVKYTYRNHAFNGGGTEYNKVNTEYNDDGYDYTEQETYAKQYEEAIAYKNSGYKNPALCPNVEILCMVRGKDLRTIVDKIIAKHQATERKIFAMLGQKQKYIDTVKKAKGNVLKIQELYNTFDQWCVFNVQQ